MVEKCNMVNVIKDVQFKILKQNKPHVLSATPREYFVLMTFLEFRILYAE